MYLSQTLNFGVFTMIIYIEKINLQNSYAVSRFVDHLIDILKTACRKNLYCIDGNSLWNTHHFTQRGYSHSNT